MADSRGGSDKRKCRRFNIPGGKAQYRKTGLIAVLLGYSAECPVVDVSASGIALICDKEFQKDARMTVRLITPAEPPLDLRCHVRRCGMPPDENFFVVGLAFRRFGRGRGENAPDALGVLKRLKAEYAYSTKVVKDIRVSDGPR